MRCFGCGILYLPKPNLNKSCSVLQPVLSGWFWRTGAHYTTFLWVNEMNNLVNITVDQTMSSIDLRELINAARLECGESKVRNDQFLQRVEDELNGELGVCKTFAHPQSGVEMRSYNLTLDQCMLVGMRESKGVRRSVLAKLKELESAKTIAVPNFSNPAEAARAWALEYEARVKAEATKAEIGSRREATAMNTASQATKRANKLEIELDQSKQYATIKRMEMLYHGQKFSWRLLKQTGIEMGIKTIDVFDINYGKVNGYHADVWREAYALEIIELKEQ